MLPETYPFKQAIHSIVNEGYPGNGKYQPAAGIEKICQQKKEPCKQESAGHYPAKGRGTPVFLPVVQHYHAREKGKHDKNYCQG